MSAKLTLSMGLCLFVTKLQWKRVHSILKTVKSHNLIVTKTTNPSHNSARNFPAAILTHCCGLFTKCYQRYVHFVSNKMYKRHRQWVAVSKQSDQVRKTLIVLTLWKRSMFFALGHSFSTQRPIDFNRFHIYFTTFI